MFLTKKADEERLRKQEEDKDRAILQAVKNRLLEQLEQINRIMGMPTDYDNPIAAKATGSRGPRGQINDLVVQAVKSKLPNHVSAVEIKEWIRTNHPDINSNSLNTKLSSEGGKKALNKLNLVQDEQDKWYLKQ